MNPLLPLAVFLLAPATGLDVCKLCDKGKLCKPHAQLEREQIERLRPELESEEPRARIDALREVAALCSEHENVPGKEAAEILATASLDDPSLRVRARAIRLLTDGQHPETTVLTLVELHEGFKANMFGLVPWLTGAREERGDAGDAMSYLEAVMRVSGGIRDDRVAKSLAAVLLSMPFEMRGQPVAMAATNSLLELGTRDAVSTVLRQFNEVPGERERRNLHNALESFAAGLELDDFPEFGDDSKKTWERWANKHRGAIPAKLGKWRGEPLEDEDDD